MTLARGSRPAALVLAVLSLAALATPALAAPEPDRTDSPYFVVPNADPGVDALPLLETRADIAISGVIAHVRVTQVYKNDGKKPLEAIYVFPGSTRSAVFAMKMKIGEREIVAEIQKKDDARKMYEDAKREGRTASLLEQQRPNVFQMNVANILPGDRVNVVMDYAELLVPDNGTYELVYPAVVGPRYTGESQNNEGWTATPHLTEGKQAPYGWDVSVRLSAGMAVKRVMSPSHPISTAFPDAGVADVTLTNKGAAGTKDFVLQYQLAGKTIETGVLLLPPDAKDPKSEGFFLAMVQPPVAVQKAEIPRREYIFIVDVSGSMHGFPIDTAKLVMNDLLDGMNAQDRFNILCFSGGNLVLSPDSLPVTPDNRARAKEFMARMQGGGGTEILGALRQALSMKTAPEYARTFVAVTDGYVSVEKDTFRTIRENLGNANFFAFGIGSSVNRYLIDGMARSGMGEPFIVMQGDDAREKAAKFKALIDRPALTDIKVAFDGFDAYDVEPAAIPDLFATRPVLVFGKYRGAAKGQITLTGTSGSGAFKAALPLASATADKSNDAIRYLWARHRIATLSDYNTLEGDAKQVAEITQLGLDHHLMTAYTSFVAIDTAVRNPGGDGTTVKHPVPLPEGVSNLAVGQPAGQGYLGGMGGGPMPSAPASKATYGKLELQVAERRVANKPVDAEPAADPKEAPRLVTPTPRVREISIAGVQVVSGPRTVAEVERQIRAVASVLKGCVGSTEKPGRVVVELVITRDGTVKTSRVVSGTPGAEGGRCLAKPYATLRLPALAEDKQGDTVVRVTLDLAA